MKWFKHFGNAKFDAKVMRVIKKYGLRGYGLYFAMVEYAADQLKTENPIPDIEQNSQDIATFFGEDTVLIEEIMLFFLNEKLFEQDENTGRVMCMKLLCHLDNTMSNNPEIKNILRNFKKLEGTYSNLKQIREDKNRLNKIKLNKTKKKKKKIDKIDKNKYLEYVYLSDEEYKKLVYEYGKEIIENKIADLDDYLNRKGKDYYTDHNRTLRNWLRKDNVKKIETKKCPKCGVDNFNGSICIKCHYIYDPRGDENE